MKGMENEDGNEGGSHCLRLLGRQCGPHWHSPPVTPAWEGLLGLLSPESAPVMLWAP